MKEETTEPNRNDNYIKHRIVSWYGEHKMLTKLLILGFLIIGFSGGYWYVSDDCSDITLELEWASGAPLLGENGTEEEEPTIEWTEGEPIELIVTIGTEREGVLLVTVESQEPGISNFCKTKGGTYTSYKLEIVSINLHESLNQVRSSVWIKSDVNPKGFKNGIYVKAELDGNCKKERHAFLKIDPASVPPPSDRENIEMFIEEHGTFIVIGILFLVVIYIIYKVHGKSKPKSKSRK